MAITMHDDDEERLQDEMDRRRPTRRLRAGTEGSEEDGDMGKRRGSFESEEEDNFDADAPLPRRSRAARGGSRAGRQHLVTEALGENEELHLRIRLLEEQLAEQEELHERQAEDFKEKDAKLVVLEKENTRLKEIYEPKNKLTQAQKEKVLSTVDHLAHDVEMRKLHQKVDELNQENDSLQEQLAESRTKCSQAEERVKENAKDISSLKEKAHSESQKLQSAQSCNSVLEKRIAELQSTLSAEKEKSQVANARLEQVTADLEAEKSKMKLRSNQEHAAHVASGRRERRRQSTHHVDSLADELGAGAGVSFGATSSVADHSILEEAEEEEDEEDRAEELQALRSSNQTLEKRVAELSSALAAEQEKAVPPGVSWDGSSLERVAAEAGPPPSMLRGFLEKKSPSSFLQLWPYQRRLFVLECGRLSWFDPGQEPSAATCKGSVDFVFNPSALEDNTASEENFVIRPLNGQWLAGSFSGANGGRLLEFRACDPELPRETWVEALKAHIEYGMRNHEAIRPLATALSAHSFLRASSFVGSSMNSSPAVSKVAKLSTCAEHPEDEAVPMVAAQN